MLARSAPCGTALMASSTDMPSVNCGSAAGAPSGFGSSLGASSSRSSLGGGGGGASSAGMASASGTSGGGSEPPQARRNRPKTENAASSLMSGTILPLLELDEPTRLSHSTVT